jgi:predicted Fe-Mo cluster-binding NifX family protein
MKIAISSSGNRLDAQLDPRFGRCAYFLIVDPADMSYEVISNQGAARSRGAGIQAAQFLAAKTVDAVVSGHVRSHVIQKLTAAGVDVFGKQQGTIKEVVAQFKSGGLKAITPSPEITQFGMGAGAGCAGRDRTEKSTGSGRDKGRCRRGI